LRPVAEKMITLAKRGDLHARRQVLSYFMDKSVANKLFDQMRDHFLDRQGGYVRILRAGHRIGDNAQLAIIQLLLADKGKGADKTVKREQKGDKKVPKKVSDKQEISKSTAKVPEPEEQKDTAKGTKKDSEVKKDSSKRKRSVSEDKKKISKGKKKDSQDKQDISKDKVKVAKRKQEKAEKP